MHRISTRPDGRRRESNKRDLPRSSPSSYRRHVTRARFVSACRAAALRVALSPRLNRSRYQATRIKKVLHHPAISRPYINVTRRSFTLLTNLSDNSSSRNINATSSTRRSLHTNNHRLIVRAISCLGSSTIALHSKNERESPKARWFSADASVSRTWISILGDRSIIGKKCTKRFYPKTFDLHSSTT